MNIQLLKHLGNIDQVAGIREYQLLRGRGEQMHVAEFHNAAGLRFTVMPDRCMDLFDFSYKGINIAFQGKNGMTSPQAYSAADGEFGEHWPGGMLVTCGLDNVSGHCVMDGIYPAHGRVSHVPAQSFGTRTYWEGDDYILRAHGEIHQTKLFGRHLSIQRTVETSLNAKSVKLSDVITNFEAADEPYMLLYHMNFGYPMIREDSVVAITKGEIAQLAGTDADYTHLGAPVDGAGEDLFLHHFSDDKACAVVYNEAMELGAYVAFDTANLPNLVQWRMMKSHDYVLGLEPGNTCGLNRADAIEQKKIAILPAYTSVETHLELGVLDGLTEIRSFIKNV